MYFPFLPLLSSHLLVTNEMPLLRLGGPFLAESSVAEEDAVEMRNKQKAGKPAHRSEYQSLSQRKGVLDPIQRISNYKSVNIYWCQFYDTQMKLKPNIYRRCLCYKHP